jgi:hypothetical protein
MTNNCSKSYPVTGASAQGAHFAEMTRNLHGGTRKFKRLNKKMRRNTRRSSRSSRNSRQSGGSFFTPYAEYNTEFSQQLPNDMHDAARISSLDAKFAELPTIERAVMAGGSRQNQSRNQSRNQRHRQNQSRRQRQNGGTAPVDEPAMLLRTPTEEMDARLNPQWYTENTVIPNFQGPIPIPGGTVAAPLAPAPPTLKVGGRRGKNRRSRNNRRN